MAPKSARFLLSVKVGDMVVLPFNIGCGFCSPCCAWPSRRRELLAGTTLAVRLKVAGPTSVVPSLP